MAGNPHDAPTSSLLAVVAPGERKLQCVRGVRTVNQRAGDLQECEQPSIFHLASSIVSMLA